jgi:hypothetical protein
MEWKTKSSKPKIFDCKSQELKQCLSLPLKKKQGTIHTESVPERKTANNELYTQVLESLLKCISTARPQFEEKGS